jgi:hypothetical protein
VEVSVEDRAVIVAGSYPAPRLDTTPEGVQPRIADLPTIAESPGQPALPHQQVTVVLPPGRSVAGLRVSGRRQAVPGTHYVAWGRPPSPVRGHSAGAGEPDPRTYASTTPYPASPSRVVHEGFFRGYRVATLQVRPVQWVPASGELFAWRELRIELELGPAHTSPAVGVRGSAHDLQALAGLAQNPETGLDYPAPAADRAEEPYLIVCPEALRSAFTRLLDHREANGLPGRIMTVEEIVSSYPGVDDPEKIREAIREAYNQRGTRFVLLAGDDEDDSGNRLVPYRGCLLDAGGYRYEDAPVDFYFGALDGTWNADGDSVWCEPDEIDYYSEVPIGRATVDTPEEADRFIDKLIAYESGLPEDRRRDLVFMGESLDDSTWGGDSMDETLKLIPDDQYDVTKLYEREGTFSRSAVIENLDRGPHLTNHLGHANDGYVMGIYSSDVDGLTNETPFFSYSQGCDSGAFDQKFSGSSEAISEHFLTAENAGFGVIMNVRYGWYSSGSAWGPSQYLGHEFFDALFQEGHSTLGEANDDSRHDNASTAQTNEYRRWCFLETNLHGDPATPVQVGNRLSVAAHRVIEDDPVHGNENGEADPGETVRLAVTLENLRDEAVSGVEGFLTPITDGVTVRNHWAAWGDIPGREQQESQAPHFTATVDVSCGEFAVFSLELRYDDGESETTTFSVLVGERTEEVLFEDDGESDLGWSSSGTCSDGEWVREVPNGTTHGDAPANPGEDASPDPGTRCFVTGNDGVSGTDDDVDAGTAVLTSPELDASGYLDLELSYSRWYRVDPRTIPPTNTFKMEITDDGGETWTLLEEVTVTETPWQTKVFGLEEVLSLGPGIAMRVTANEREGAHSDVLVEAGLDDVVFEGTKAYCEDFEPSAGAPPSQVGNTLRAHRDGAHVRLEWAECGGGASHDPAQFYRVRRAAEPGAEGQQIAETADPHYVDCDACEEGTYHEYLVTAWNEAGSETP